MDNPKMDEKPLRKLISDAYPWGERENHPYKIWCSAVAECLWSLRKIGRKPTKTDKEGMNLFNQGELF